MVTYIRIEQILFFFPLVNYGSNWTAGKNLLLSGLDMTLFTAVHMCDISHHATWIEPFPKWPSIKRQNKFGKFGFAQYIVKFAHFGFFNIRGIYWDKKKRKIWRQLPFNLSKVILKCAKIRLLDSAIFKLLQSQSKRFRWRTDMVNSLIDCLNDNQSKMEWRSLNLNAVKQIQYKE